MNCLENIGLSKGEIKVYEAILDIGTSTINKIQEITVIERRNIYDIINKLIHKGLISYTVEKGKKTYRCTHPNKILSYLEEKKNNIEKEEENIRKELPKIIEKFKLSKPAISAQTFIGKEGIKAIFEEILNYKKSYFIGGGWYVIKELPYFWSHYNEKRIEKKIKWYNLVRYELRNEKPKKIDLIEIKYLPKEFSGSPHVIFIFGNKIVNVMWGKEIFAFMIESKEIADNYKKYHNYLWKNIAKEK